MKRDRQWQDLGLRAVTLGASFEQAPPVRGQQPDTPPDLGPDDRGRASTESTEDTRSTEPARGTEAV